MDTAKLKKFAQESRKELMNVVSAKLEFVLAPDSLARRESKSAVEALEGLIKEIGKDEVVEKVAYTWFNRFCALRFMDANRYTKISIVSPIEGQTQPEILAEAKMNYIDESVVSSENITKIRNLLNGSMTSNDAQGEAYKLLIVSYCNYYNKQLPFMFESINNYTELLLPDDLLSQSSALTKTLDVLDNETCKDVEVIGWLYQYYISEKKETLDFELKNKKNRKVQKEDMPAKTQLFTPKWIVEYMVENSVGKMWLESHPDERLQSQFKYYLEPAEQEADVQNKLNEMINKDLKPQDIKVLDPACGSGHILVTAFSVLFEIYKSQGWQENEIPEMILKNNLYGLDICDRAAQLSQFAVMMKAREYDKSIFDKVHNLNICSIKDTNWIESYVVDEILKKCHNNPKAKEQVELLRDTFKDAKEYGSILNVKGIDFEFWDKCLNAFKQEGQISTLTPMIRGRLPYILKQAKIMQQKYECLVTNPPYLGSNYYNIKLTEYTEKNYQLSNNDLCILFIDKAIRFLNTSGILSMITMHSWMAGKTNVEFRKSLYINASIQSMLHLGSRAFNSISGEIVQTTTFTMRKYIAENYNGIYFDLKEGKSEEAKKRDFLEKKEITEYYESCIKDFKKNPDFQLIYNNLTNNLLNNPNAVLLNEKAKSCTGMQTGGNDKYVRFWQEVEYTKSVLNNVNGIWYRYNCGGKICKWYGNHTNVVYWANDGSSIKNEKSSVIRNSKYFLQEGISWKRIGSSINAFRYLPEGFIFDQAGDSMFVYNKCDLFYILALINSKVARVCLEAISPTNNLTAGTMDNLPIIVTSAHRDTINKLVQQNIAISKDEWDSFEASWDFEQHPLLKFKQNGKVQDSFKSWQEHAEQQFNQLKANEKELNRLFIEIYDLQEEMTSEVEDNDITIRKADELREIKSLLSYAVGCMLGRYSLDEKGLIFAGGEFDKTRYKSFEVDDDAVIPVLSEHLFPDDITSRFKDFLKAAFGNDCFDENLEYVANVLGKKNTDTADDTIRNYFLKDFYNDHVKMYQKRPIYWMFSSGKGNFNALVYMHRYNKDTASVILNSYLRNFRDEKLKAQIENCKQIELSASTSQGDKIKASKRREELEKIVKEVTDYERDILYPLATERKEIDLDDGVKVNYLKFGKALKDIGLKAK